MAETTRRTKFMKVRCEHCKNEQIIFSKAATHISCLVCNKPIAAATGGKVDVKAQVAEVI